MRLHLIREGGLVGTTLTADVDSADVPAPEQATAKALLDGTHQVAGGSEPGRSRDAFRYTLTLEDPPRRRVVHLTDGDLDDATAGLVQALITTAKAPRTR